MLNESFQKIDISEEMIGQRLDKALSFHFQIQTRSRAALLIDENRVRVNGISQKPRYVVQPKDIIEVSFPKSQPTELQPYDLKLDILFEDQDILVVNKPAGLVVHPAAGHAHDTLVNALISHTDDFEMKFGEDRPGIVHRIDKETSGILVVAKNDQSQESLQLQFKERSVHRIYFAAVFGTPLKSQGKITTYLARHPVDRKRFASILDENKKPYVDSTHPPPVGKWAVTNFTRLESKSDISYLQLKLETGRTHQIRVHLSELGHPILKDTTYGADRKLKSVSSSHIRGRIADLPRFALHAAELGFVHPKSREPMHFSASWPDDMREFLASVFVESAKTKGRGLF